MISIPVTPVEEHFYLCARERHGQGREGVVLSILVGENAGAITFLVEWDTDHEHFIEVVRPSAVVLTRTSIAMDIKEPVLDA